MKIVFAGGGTGGHFYPLMAIAEEINRIVEAGRYVNPKLYYVSDKPYNKAALFDNDIKFVKIPAGKRRLYFSFKNFFDLIKIFFGIIIATWKLFWIFPDVVVSKGGYASFPTVVAAWILRIPIIVHESDSIPGRANLIAGKMAREVAIAYPEAAEYFNKKKTALVGIPVRSKLHKPITTGAHEFLNLDPDIPVILVLGGSQGAERINRTILNALPDLLPKYQILHQVGAANIEQYKNELDVVLPDTPYRAAYKTFGYLNQQAIAMAAGVSSLVITRAGSTSLAEIALWGLPAVVVPIPKEISRDQERNAFHYTRTGAGILLEEKNLTHHILVSEVDRIMNDQNLLNSMSVAAKEFAKPDAATKMAQAVLDIVVEHEDN